MAYHGIFQINKGAILAIQLGDIGDVVLTFPGLRALKAAFPDNALVVCVRKKAGALVEMCAGVDAVLTVDQTDRSPAAEIRYQFDFFRALRRRRYDLSIDFRTGSRGAIVSLLSKARERLGFYDNEEKYWRNRVFTRLVDTEYQPGIHVADYYFELIKWMGLPSAGPDPEIAVPQSLTQNVLDLLKARGMDGSAPFIVMQPFSLWPYKELQPDKYADIIDGIHARTGMPMVLSGGAGEKVRAQEISDRSRARVVNLAGATTIGQLAGLLSLADLFIGVDSAGLHIAAATGTPTVGIFGPSDPRSWAPRGSGHTVIQPGDPCVPCRLKGCANSGVSRCLDDLPVGVVMRAIDPILDRLMKKRTERWSKN